MAKKAATVDEYLAAQPEAAQATLKKVRKAIRSALPKAEEVISYSIPAYKMGDGVVLWFAGWKAHYSLYPVTGRLLEELKRELAPYKIAKGTIRFPLSEPVPVELISRIAKLRASEGARRKVR